VHFILLSASAAAFSTALAAVDIGRHVLVDGRQDTFTVTCKDDHLACAWLWPERRDYCSVAAGGQTQCGDVTVFSNGGECSANVTSAAAVAGPWRCRLVTSMSGASDGGVTHVDAVSLVYKVGQSSPRLSGKYVRRPTLMKARKRSHFPRQSPLSIQAWKVSTRW